MDMRFLPVRELAGWLDTHSGLLPLLVRTPIHTGHCILAANQPILSLSSLLLRLGKCRLAILVHSSIIRDTF